MDELLPYYERELSMLRNHAWQFAKRYPKIAGQLQINSETAGDPHVERLIESFALLTSRINKKLEDNYPEFTEALLNVIYPHYLKPFPSCGIIELYDKKKLSNLTKIIKVSRGITLHSRPVNNVKCGFNVSFDTFISSAVISSVEYQNIIPQSKFSNLSKSDASSLLTITLCAGGDNIYFDTLNLPYLRVYLDCDAALSSQIKELFFMRTSKLFVQFDNQELQEAVLEDIIKLVGFNDNEALLPFDARSAQVYRIITEFFAFPEKFNFIDFHLDKFKYPFPKECKTVKFYFAVNMYANLSNLDHKMLEQLSPRHFVVNCVPAVNLYKKAASPIFLNHKNSSYPIVIDNIKPDYYELYSIESVKRIAINEDNISSIKSYKPFYHLKFNQSESENRYWFLNYDSSLADLSTGFEYQISISDIDNDKAENNIESAGKALSLDVMTTNRDLPSMLQYGLVEGDLFSEQGNSEITYAKFITKPSRCCRFKRGDGMRWRLISHLNFNHFSLVSSGGELLREMLSLYNINQSVENKKLIESIVNIEQKSIFTKLNGKTYPVFIKGVEIKVFIDRKSLIGTGEYLFSRILDELFGMYVHANSFIKLILVCSVTMEEIIQCPPRNGQLVLI